MSAHTRAPWFHNETWGLIEAKDGTQVCALHSGVKANAKLIAAAPDLLAALRLVDSIWSHDQTANIAPDSPAAIVRAAIAKATEKDNA